MLPRAALLALALARAGVPGDAGADGGAPRREAEKRPYEVEKGPDPTLAAGSKASLLLRLVARGGGCYIHPDGPLRIKLRAAGPVSVERSALGRADAIDPRPGEKAAELAFRIPIAAAEGQSGEGQVTAEVAFYLCRGEWCRQVRDRVVYVVAVRRQ